MAGDPLPPRAGRRQGGIPDGLLVGLLCFLLAVTVLMWTGTGLAALLGHGHWPHALRFTRTPQAMRELLVHPGDIAGAWPDVPAADLPRPGLLWGIFIGEVLVVLVLGGFAIGTLTRYRAVRAALRRTAPVPPAAVPPAPAPAAVTTPVATPVPTPAPTPVPVAETAVEQLPEPGPVPAAPTAPAAPAVQDTRLTASHVLFADPRSEKGKRIVQPAVLEADGAVLVTCADEQTWRQTAGARAKLGPVHVFDPEHLVDTPDRLRWAPHTGCEDPRTATARARALLAPLRTHDVTANDAAATLLRCWLHAAAVDGQPFRQLHRWAAGTASSAGEALRILRTARDAASGWSGELEATLHAHPERRDTAHALIQQALSGLNSVHIRDACNPSRSDSKAFDLESFVHERGTLYVVGEPREDPRTRPGAMPLLTALVSSVVEHGRRMAAGSSPGRLDPPLTCVFDDIAALAPFPELPALMADGPAQGIVVLSVLRSEEQARHRWAPREAPGIWQSATSRLTLDS